MQLLFIFSVILFNFLSVGDGAKILAIFNMASRSHFILGNTYLRAVAEAGHDVTMVSPFVDKNPPKNGSYRNIVLSGFIEAHQEWMNQMKMEERTNLSPFQIMDFMLTIGPEFTNRTLNEPNFKALINSKEKFDVLVIEQFMNDALKVLAPHFGAHLVVFSTVGANTWVNPLVCNPSPPSYIPELISGLSAPMNFRNRLTNTLYRFGNNILHYCFLFPAHKQLAQQYISAGATFEDSLYNASLVFLNSHPSLNDPVPHVPNMIEIGGFHVQAPKKLPKHLQEFLDEAKEGVIYFSMGSNLQSSQFPELHRQAFLNTFAKLKKQVLWKWDADDLPGKPSNVKLEKWLPQQDILAHPNVKVFITHGGLLSTIETVYHGVPILAIPIIGEQKMNAKTAETSGYGLVLPFEEVNEELLTEKLMDILTNPRYEENVKIRSKILLDRQIKPIDTAVYWTEYVIRHNGAKHLRVAGLDLPWYQYYLLDVFGFLIVVTLALLLILKKVLFFIVHLFRRNNAKTNIKKKVL